MKLKLLTRLLTNNLKEVPLVYINFNMQKYKKDGKKGSCDCVMHPLLSNDQYILNKMKEICDYIREEYDMENII